MPTNRKLAEFRGFEIEKDILDERFDPTLENYKPKSALSKVTSVTPITPNQKQKPKLDELWGKYSELKNYSSL